jgi:ADP-ribosylation factor 1/2
MGNIFENLFTGLFGKQEIKMLILGLDYSGKTSILHKMKLNENVVTIPTVSFNIETVEYKHINFTILDICSEKFMRAFWKATLIVVK